MQENNDPRKQAIFQEIEKIRELALLNKISKKQYNGTLELLNDLLRKKTSPYVAQPPEASNVGWQKEEARNKFAKIVLKWRPNPTVQTPQFNF